uniref:Uncharacterized protein n=1 Tax=Knipowitschia caucasica TaxID=637954 RepID=A0AAV2KD08_KNICA
MAHHCSSSLHDASRHNVLSFSIEPRNLKAPSLKSLRSLNSLCVLLSSSAISVLLLGSIRLNTQAFCQRGIPPLPRSAQSPVSDRTSTPPPRLISLVVGSLSISPHSLPSLVRRLPLRVQSRSWNHPIARRPFRPLPQTRLCLVSNERLSSLLKASTSSAQTSLSVQTPDLNSNPLNPASPSCSHHQHRSFSIIFSPPQYSLTSLLISSSLEAQFGSHPLSIGSPVSYPLKSSSSVPPHLESVFRLFSLALSLSVTHGLLESRVLMDL